LRRGAPGWARARPALLVFVAALALRLVHVALVDERYPWAQALRVDEESYDRWATRIVAGEWIGKDAFFQDPLYPYALAGVYAVAGRDPAPVRILQAVVDAGSCAGIAILARILGGIAAAWIAGGLAALYAPFLYFVGQFDKATFVVAASTAMLLAWVRARERPTPARAALLGATLGAACLLRGNFLVFVPLLAAAIVVQLGRGAARPLLAFAGGVAILLGPVVVRNGVVAGEFVLTTAQAGTNFYIGNAPNNPFGISKSIPFVRTIPRYEADDWKREAERRTGASLTRGEVSRYWTREAWREMGRDPREAALRWGRKAALLVNDFEVPDNHSFEYASRFLPTLRFPFFGFGIAGALGLAGLLAQARRKPMHPLLLFVAVYAATVVATVSADRIRVAIVPALLAAAGTFFPWLRRAGSRARLAGLAGAGLALFLTHAPVFPSAEVERKHYHWVYEHALLLARTGDLDEAERLLGEVLARYRGDPHASLVLAEVAAKRGNFAEAERLVRERVLPGADRLGDRTLRHKGHLALGWIATFGERDEEAVANFEAALAFDPDDVDTRNAIAAALANLGRTEEALRHIEEALRIDPTRWLTHDTLSQIRRTEPEQGVRNSSREEDRR
jgi:tetratricopeptide (TPR) repeat protein